MKHRGRGLVDRNRLRGAKSAAAVPAIAGRPEKDAGPGYTEAVTAESAPRAGTIFFSRAAGARRILSFRSPRTHRAARSKGKPIWAKERFRRRIAQHGSGGCN